LSRKTIIYRNRIAYKADNRAQALLGFQAIQNENLKDGRVSILYASPPDQITDPPQRTATDDELLEELANDKNVKRV